jgi:SAM-dependent methyltransferase
VHAVVAADAARVNPRASRLRTCSICCARFTSAVRWLAKAVVQKTLSYAPRSDDLNHVVQRRLYRSLPAGDAHARTKFARARQQFETFLEYGTVDDPARPVFYEFGVGWDLRVPLAYASLGVEHQILVDLHPHARSDLVNDSIRRLDAARPAHEQELGRALRPLGPPDVERIGELEPRFGIQYLAPRDARATGLDAHCVDFVSSTDTLEHVPADDIPSILVECRRLLRPDGVLSCRIDLEDHYFRFDRSLSRYNFLRYSDRTWSLVNSSLHYQNRLRYPDYVRLVRDAGFEIVRERVSWASEQQLKELSRLPLAERFRNGQTPEELAVRGVTLVARPAHAA